MEKNSAAQARMRAPAENVRIRATGLCSALGGAFLTAYSLFASVLPEGVAEGPHRDAGVLDELFLLPGLLFVCGSALGACLLHQGPGKATMLVRSSAVTAALCLFFGVAVLPAAWYVGVVLVCASLLAFVLTGLGLSLTRTLPAWCGLLLAVTSLMLFGFNTEDSRVLFLMPFALVWILVSILLFVGRFRTTR